MKKIALILAILLLLTACAPAAPAETTEAPSAEASSLQTDAPTEAATQTEVSTAAPTETEAVESTLAIALSFVDRSVDELKAALGEPDDAYYGESCIGDGEDGILTYGAVTVYTYREADGSAETVIDAE